MCPVCVLTIGGGLLLGKKLGINNLLVIGLATVILSIAADLLIRRSNKGRSLFPFQKIIISTAIFISVTVLSYFLL